MKQFNVNNLEAFYQSFLIRIIDSGRRVRPRRTNKICMIDFQCLMLYNTRKTAAFGGVSFALRGSAAFGVPNGLNRGKKKMGCPKWS